MMELHFLGTGSAFPSPLRGASCTVLHHQKGCYVFDCGEGSQTKIMESSIKPGRISKIFITHLHGDHVFGLPGLLCTMGLNCEIENKTIEIYGPVGLRKFVRNSLQISQSHLGYQYVVHEIKLSDSLRESFGGETPCIVYSDTDENLHPDELQGRRICEGSNGLWEICRDESLTIYAAPLKHRTICFGYVVIEDQIAGKLDPSLLKLRGIPPGPLYARIKKGESIVAPDGSVVTPSEVVGPPRAGRKIVILGDTCDSSKIASAALNCHCLVHEATNEDELEDKTIAHGHSTPRMAGQFAHEIQAEKLVLTHFSQRYKKLSNNDENSDSPTLSKLLEQAKIAFQSNNVVVAEDLTVVKIPMRNC